MAQTDSQSIIRTLQEQLTSINDKVNENTTDSRELKRKIFLRTPPQEPPPRGTPLTIYNQDTDTDSLVVLCVSSSQVSQSTKRRVQRKVGDVLLQNIACVPLSQKIDECCKSNKALKKSSLDPKKNNKNDFVSTIIINSHKI